MQILDTFSQPLFTCVCMHLGCTAVGGRYSEADQWLECWLGCGSVLVRNKKRVSEPSLESPYSRI